MQNIYAICKQYGMTTKRALCLSTANGACSARLEPPQPSARATCRTGAELMWLQFLIEQVIPVHCTHQIPLTFRVDALLSPKVKGCTSPSYPIKKQGKEEVSIYYVPHNLQPSVLCNWVGNQGCCY